MAGFLPGWIHFSGRDQVLASEADQVFAVAFQERFFYQIVILRIPILDQRTLHGFFMRIRRDIYLLHGDRVESGVVHTG